MGSPGSRFGGNLSLTAMGKLALRLKIWGWWRPWGTLTAFETLDQGLLNGQLLPLFRQGLFLLSAFQGAHLAQALILHLTGPEPPP